MPIEQQSGVAALGIKGRIRVGGCRGGAVGASPLGSGRFHVFYVFFWLLQPWFAVWNMTETIPIFFRAVAKL